VPPVPHEEEIPEDDPDAPHERYKKPVLTVFPGVNRLAWDLRYKGADKIRGVKVDMGTLEQGPLVNPGTYTLKLTVGGTSLTGDVVVQPDPRVHLSLADLNEQLQFALRVRDDLTRLTRLVNEVRSIREQLENRDRLLRENHKAESLTGPSRELVQRLTSLEEKLHNPKAEVTYDILAQKGGAMLYSQYAALFEWVKDADGPPTQGMRQVYGRHRRELEKYAEEFHSLVAGDLARVNETARHLKIPSIIVPDEQEMAKKR
jgi:hypothetical protein